MKSLILVGGALLVGCGARSSLGEGAPDASTEAALGDVRTSDAHGGCSPHGPTPVKLADLAGPITDAAAIELVGPNVYFITKAASAKASTLFRVATAGGPVTPLATDVACAGLDANGTYLAYSSTSGRFVALPLGGGASISTEAEGRASCPIHAVGKKEFYYRYESPCCAAIAHWVPPADAETVGASTGLGPFYLDEEYWYACGSNSNGSVWTVGRTPLDTLNEHWEQLATVPPGSQMIGLSSTHVILGPPAGPVFRVKKSGGDAVKVADSIGVPRAIDDTAIFAVGINGAPATSLGRVRFTDGVVDTLAQAKNGRILAIGVDACNVAWIESDPPALMIRSR